MKLKKPFNPDVLYNHIVHYYIDKKGVTKEDANKIAQNVISKELQRHICQDTRCKHLSSDHIRKHDTASSYRPRLLNVIPFKFHKSGSF